MDIIQPTTQQHPQTTLGANVRTMIGYVTSETMFGRKTQIGVGATQTGESIKGDTVHRDEHWKGEQ
jgi:hypothetical protein